MRKFFNCLKEYRKLPLHTLENMEDKGDRNLLLKGLKIAKLLNLKVHNKFTGRNVRSPKDKMYWCKEKSDIANFGDEIGPFIYKNVTGSIPVYATPKNSQSEGIYLTVGSIMGAARTNCIIWGSGIMYTREYFQKPYKTYAVRGPYTRKRYLDLGYDCPKVYGDPSLVLPKIYYPHLSKKYRIGIIPHFVEYLDSQKIKFKKDILVIDLRREVESVIDNILSCEKIISSSLHGIIVAHAYGIPATWIKFSNKLIGDDIKFYDYFASVGIYNISPLKIGMSNLVKINYNKMFHVGQQPTNTEDVAKRIWQVCPFLTK